LKVNSFTSGSVAMENQNLKEVNVWMTEDVVSWLKDTGQETIQNIIIGTIIMMQRLPFTVSLNTTWEKRGCHDDNGIISWFVYINDLSLANEWKRI
jgi:hypothetical protein